jgi:choline/glycine/proline betaine transport protein
MKSCFYPLIGDRIFGWIGDFIDVISIMSTLFGVCTILGMGARQLNFGLSLMSDSIAADDILVQVCQCQLTIVVLILLPKRFYCHLLVTLQ